jgi:hypothetical protein
VEYRAVGEVVWLTTIEPGGAVVATERSIPGLERGQSYEFRVRAENEIGNGDWASIAGVAPDVPAPPSDLRATAASGHIGVIRLSWDAPVSLDGELAVIGYVIQQSSNGEDWATIGESDDNSTTTTYYVTELPRSGEGYWFRVAAQNGLPNIADSQWDFAAVATPVNPYGFTGGVEGLKATAGSVPEQVLIAWAAPDDTGGYPVYDYVVQYRKVPDGGDTENPWETWSDGMSSNRAVLVTGLMSGGRYIFRVKAVTVALPHALDAPDNPNEVWKESEEVIVG